MSDNKSKHEGESSTILRLVTDIVSAYVGKNAVGSEDLPMMIRTVHSTLLQLDQGPIPTETKDLVPAVPIKKSVTADFIVCLEDGKKLKMLKRYLRAQFGMTPEESRARWGLPVDYPMVAPNYAAQRSTLAKQIGLGRNTDTLGRGRRKK